MSLQSVFPDTTIDEFVIGKLKDTYASRWFENYSLIDIDNMTEDKIPIKLWKTPTGINCCYGCFCCFDCCIPFKKTFDPSQ